MPTTKPVSLATLWWARHGIRIDRVSLEVHAAFAAAGIPSLLLKGPAIAGWLYPPEDLRPYGDSDFLVPHAQWSAAGDVLRALGFSSKEDVMQHPGMATYSSAAWRRGDDNVDLHATISGLEAPFADVWNVLWSTSTTHRVLHEDLPVLGVPARTMHLALHAAHHHPDEQQPRRDLEQGLAVLAPDVWRDAMKVARRLDGLPAFSAGLRRSPTGTTVADTIELPEAQSVRTRLRASGAVPLSESLNELFDAPGFSERVKMVRTELFPRPSFMRWWSPLARRGSRGLIAAYLWRPLWLLWHFPPALRAVLEARNEQPPAGETPPH